jgi:pimeloyl-ACP methyl ester carboxylesterase
MLPVIGAELTLVGKVLECVEVRIYLQDDVPPAPAIAAIRPAPGNILFAPEVNRAIATITRAHRDGRFVEVHTGDYSRALAASFPVYSLSQGRMPMTQVIKYKNQCRIAYAEYGDTAGYPILVQHGLIASIRDDHIFDRLIRLGTHLICIARPGYGESSPYAMSCLGEWGQIVAMLADEFNYPRFDVLGMSSGAPYSYAIGSHLPDRVRNIFVFSGTPALFDERVLALWPYPVDRQASLDELERLAHELFFSQLAGEDLHRNDISDSMQNNCFGIAQDLKLRCIDWGFDLSSVRANVYMQHGYDDSQVPLRTAEITASLLPNCHLEIREKGGHFTEALLDAFISATMVEHYANH